jgi:HAD superfamily hydrolase (TIGR01509 family)
LKKCVIFDVDGTIISSEEIIIKTTQIFAEKYLEKKLTYEQCFKIIGVNTENILRRIGVDEGELNVYFPLYTGLLSEMSKEMRLFDGIRELIAALHQKGYFLGIVTSRVKSEFDDAMGRYGLGRYFGCVIVADQTKNHKPHPEPLHLFMKKTGFSENEILYIGDSINDYLACQAADIDFVLAKWGCIDDSGVKAPDFAAKQPCNVLEILNQG